MTKWAIDVDEWYPGYSLIPIGPSNNLWTWIELSDAEKADYDEAATRFWDWQTRLGEMDRA